MTTKRRRQADRQLGDILGRVRYVGPEPPPSEDEIMDRVADEIRATRAERLLPGEAAALDEGETEFREGKTSRLEDVLRRLRRRKR